MRTIDADALRDEVDSTLNWNTNNEYNMYSDVMDMIDDAPTIDVQPVKHGRWLVKFEGEIYEFSECSECGNTESCETPYCAQCGARMDGGNEDEND